MSKVVDVSTFQGSVDWAKVKSNVDGAILRAGYRGYETKGGSTPLWVRYPV